MPVVTEPRKAAGALGSAVAEMERRYKLLAENGVPNIEEYNALAEMDESIEKMPYIVIVIDELADLMMVAGKEVEDYICRIAQKARAAGMHLIVATQRPSVDVITGLIKANIPSRIGLSVMSQIDSRTILDTGGAEKLLGNGDMLYMPVGVNKPVRVQGTFVRSAEIRAVIDFIKKHSAADYDEEMIAQMDKLAAAGKAAARPTGARVATRATPCSARRPKWSSRPGRPPPACCSAGASWVTPVRRASSTSWNRPISWAPTRARSRGRCLSRASSGWRWSRMALGPGTGARAG